MTFIHGSIHAFVFKTSITRRHEIGVDPDAITFRPYPFPALDHGDPIRTRLTIKRTRFTENQDFVCSPILGSEGRGGHNRKDYHLTIDMAKDDKKKTGTPIQEAGFFVGCLHPRCTPEIKST